MIRLGRRGDRLPYNLWDRCCVGRPLRLPQSKMCRATASVADPKRGRRRACPTISEIVAV